MVVHVCNRKIEVLDKSSATDFAFYIIFLCVILNSTAVINQLIMPIYQYKQKLPSRQQNIRLSVLHNIYTTVIQSVLGDSL